MAAHAERGAEIGIVESNRISHPAFRVLGSFFVGAFAHGLVGGEGTDGNAISLRAKVGDVLAYEPDICHLNS